MPKFSSFVFIALRPLKINVQHSAPMQNDEILKAIAKGDKEALGALYDEFAPAIYGLALRITESKDRANLVVVEVFRKIWNRASSFDPYRINAFAWVMDIAKKVAIEHESKSEQFDFFAFQKSNSSGYSLEDLFRQIDEKHRKVLELSFFRNLSESQVEEHMNIPVGTVATRLRIAIKAMRKVLG